MILASLRALLLSAVAATALTSVSQAQEAPPSAPPAPPAAAPVPAQEAAPSAGEDGEAVDPATGEPQDADAAPAAAPAPPIPAVWSPVPRNEDGVSAYGLFLAGRVALLQGQGELGAAKLATASELTPEQPMVRDRAFTATLLGGDLDTAARLAPAADESSPTLTQAGVLVRAVQDLAHDRARSADNALKATPVQAPHARAGLLVQPWIAAAAGDWTRALAQPPVSADPLTALFARQNRAALLERRGRYDEADAEFKTLTGFAQSGALFRLPYGEFLERRGRRAEAITLYDAAIAAGQGDEQIRQARQRASSGGRAPAAPDLRQGAAQALNHAAMLAASERAMEFSAFYLRLAASLSPTDEIRFRLGQALGRARLSAAAQDVLRQVSRDDPALYAAAQVQLGITQDADDKPDAALVSFQRAAQTLPADPAIARILAGQLNQEKRYQEALDLLNGPLLNTPDQPFEVRFLRGAAYESLGQIDQAENELWAALQLQPENASALNYLGYLWVDQGRRVEQGAEMIARAFAAEPENANIQDSLGWAQYRQGRYEEAVTTLEAAVSKQPANASINDHLGDAYWQVGRRREAQFQWARVLTLEADADLAASAQRKLDQGLTPTDGSTAASS